MRIGLGIGLNRFRGGQAAGPVNTVAPEVTGTAERGETLTCSTGTWTGTGTITYAFQWLRDGVEIAGATNSTYTPVAADDNTFIRCRVTTTDDEGSRSAFSNVVGPVLGAPLNLTAPVLSGTETVEQALSVTDGTWQGVAPISFGYQWRRDGVNISGATSNTYTLVAADYDTVIDCVLPATNSFGTTEADSNDTGAIAGLAPVNTVAPSITGSTGLGDTLTRTEGTWSGVPTPSLTGQWRRNGVVIPGETGATYTIVAADSGADIDYLETATNAEGTASADSNDITVQTFVSPTIGGVPTIAGTEEVGETLTATAASVTGNPTPVRTWQWQRSNDGSTGWADISGATNSTYLLDAADEGKFVRAKQIETNALGSDEAVSAASGEIQAGGAAGLLDSYKGSAFAMSPDTLLYSTYSATDDISGSVTNSDTGQFSVAILRDSDNAVRSFTPAEVADGTANTWVQAGVGGAANGFVRRGYDQSVTALDVSNLNHADQSDPTKMPKLFDSVTGLVVENGKAALDFNTVTLARLITPIIDFNSDEQSSFVALKKQSDNSLGIVIEYSVDADKNNGSFFLAAPRNNGQSTYGVRSKGTSLSEVVATGYPAPSRNLISFISKISTDYIELWVDSVSAGTNSANQGTGNFLNHKLHIGARGASGVIPSSIYLNSVAIYNSDQSANRTAIETAINNEYNIYP